MKKISRYVVKKELDDGIVMLNTKNNRSIKVSHALLEKMKTDAQTKRDYETYLENQNFYLEENEFQKMMTSIFEKENRTLRLTIFTHGDCNFRCLYCYEKFENISMSQETMDNIIKFAEQKLEQANYSKLQLSWFGGEPLLGYKTILYLTGKLQDICSKYQIIFVADMTTNGYLLDKNKFKILIEKCKVTTFQITIDGNQESHDQQRMMKNGKGTYQRIYQNIVAAQQTDLKFLIILRFNVSKSNYEEVKNFMNQDSLLFKNDQRFCFLYRNVGNWGQGERPLNHQVVRLEKDISYQFSKEAISQGYHVHEPLSALSNRKACYAQNPNNYTFSVRGQLMACTVLIYDNKNNFGNVNTMKFEEEKRKNLWLHSIEKIPEDCKKCEIVAICKGGSCPKLFIADRKLQSAVCRVAKRRFSQMFDLYIIQNLVEVTLDVD
ncbi:radical SAM/SPASM domain-containing protein [Lactococcus nasutitermitis]|uniref:Radical SAM/SPASM domain-containing protein n=1 Tax=Lactococcus nasutitermitis TaxID=1652957 RepID=A0ABV9JFZ9_9LACT|nr:radical SAM protein [Lactococcus nasutitermitis]